MNTPDTICIIEDLLTGAIRCYSEQDDMYLKYTRMYPGHKMFINTSSGLVPHNISMKTYLKTPLNLTILPNITQDCYNFTSINPITDFFILELCERAEGKIQASTLSYMWSQFLNEYITPLELSKHNHRIRTTKLDRAITSELCDRNYTKGSWNFVEFILASPDRKCNCLCGSVGLMSILLSYDLFTTPLCLYTSKEHIFIGTYDSIRLNRSTYYETTLPDSDRKWRTLEKLRKSIGGIFDVILEPEDIVLYMILYNDKYSSKYLSLVPTYRDILTRIISLPLVQEDTDEYTLQETEKYRKVIADAYSLFKHKKTYGIFHLLCERILSNYIYNDAISYFGARVHPVATIKDDLLRIKEFLPPTEYIIRYRYMIEHIEIYTGQSGMVIDECLIKGC